MKLSELFKLKELVLVHNQEFSTKEFSTQQEYRMYKELILERIELIESLKLKEEKYLKDIDSYLFDLKEKLKIPILPGGEVKEKAEGSQESLIPK